ncbi:MAG: EF-hand domain-containing protein [Alphaproteobacteria bacterium]|nr:EF-hand domain-containing protein [Alphaproteobacteria bacterium]
MKRLISPLVLAAAALALPAAAQTPPTQGWPANRPPDQSSPQAKPPQQPSAPTAGPTTGPTTGQNGPRAPAAPGTPGAQAAAGTPTANGAPAATAPPGPVPLPQWFYEIDTKHTGEVSRADFLKFRMRSFEELDANKDGKLSLDEFLKVAEPPFSNDVPGGPSLEDRRNRARAEFQNLDTNRDGFVERAEAEALVHAEFNQYDTDRDNKVTEPELRLIVQRSIAREAAERQQAEAQRRQGKIGINDFIDMQLREADKLDKNGDGKVSQQEYLLLAGPADGEQAKNLLPFDIRKQLVLRKFQEIDTNKDGQLDRVELTSYAVRQFIDMDGNKDRFLTEEEFKKAQEAETKKMRALIQTMQPAQPPPQPRPAPAQPKGAGQPQPAPAPAGLAPGLPQGTR